MASFAAVEGAATARAFWSYVHADNDAEQGRVVDLGHDVRDQYGLLTGSSLDLFLDRDALDWGDDWRARIAEELSAATFFIPVMTPRYFDSAECRRELIAFAREAGKLGVDALLLPILYARVPELESDDVLDEAMQLVKPRHYEDWTELRLEDRGSPAYLKGVYRLAQRLADTVVSVSKPSEPTNVVRATEVAEDAEDEEPGYLELLAEGESAMPRWREVIESFGQVMEELAEIATRGAQAMEESDRHGGSAAGRLRVANRTATEMREPANRLLSLGERNTRELKAIDGFVGALFDRLAEEPPSSPEEREETKTMFDAIEGMPAPPSRPRAFKICRTS